ncbi:TPA: hypothetical protein P0E24_005067 [Vibrio campbellii]|nr:hypothetical protein [Vibrio campbellii]
MDLYVHAYASDINPESILCELRALENNDFASKTKPATQFRRLPLKGLWHKHFYTAQFMPQNRLNAHRGGRLESEITRVFNEFDESKFDSKLEAYKAISLEIALASERLGNEREDENLLTGEWIVFAKHESKNYYFCVAPHHSDEKIYAQVIKSCGMDFPNLTEVIENYT